MYFFIPSGSVSKFITLVAPNLLASSNLDGTLSTTTTLPNPKYFKILKAHNPTGPAPNCNIVVSSND